MNRREFFRNVAVGSVLTLPRSLAQGSSQRLAGNPSLDPKKYLLLDSRIVDRAEDVTLELGKIIKDPQYPLFIEEKPWEVRFDNLYANVFFDEEEQIFKCWYSPFVIDDAVTLTSLEQRKSITYRQALKGRRREMGVCYATSQDGISWIKPELGIVNFNGASKNNLVSLGPHGAGIWKDPRDPRRERRYKMLFVQVNAGTGSGRYGQMSVAFSPDGLHWSDSILCEQLKRSDTHNNSLWVESRGEYVGITRLWEDGVRVVGRTRSRDFLTWEPAVRCLGGDRVEQTYAMLVFPYASAYLGLLMIFNTSSDMVDCELAWSPDTVHWERLCPGKPLIPRGPQGSRDSDCIFAAAYPILRNDEIRLYYGGSDGPHTNWRQGSFCLARLGKDRFAGYMPSRGSRVGTVVTKPIECTGKHLRVSADAAGASLRVAVLGAESFSFEACRRITTNVTDCSIEWKGAHNLAALKGRPVRLAFELQGSKIYAFSFAD